MNINLLFKKCLSFAGKYQDPFTRFQARVNKSTWNNHDEILDWAFKREQLTRDQPIRASSDPLVARGMVLKKEVETQFYGKYSQLGRSFRILVHVPDFEVSPGGYSLFNNLVAAFNFIGIPAKSLCWNDRTSESIANFRPTCLMTSDHTSYLERIDWKVVADYKKVEGLKVGLTASLEQYGNSPLYERLSWARRNSVDFFYSFRSPDYLAMRPEYSPFFEEGYHIYSIEFGANPAHYFPVENNDRDLAYVFLASSNPDKQERYSRYLIPIVKNFKGFIDGPGWKKINRYAPASVHKHLYSRARIGINLHIPDSIDRPNELNERTYIIAACGLPQLIDTARLLPKRFGKNCFFVADDPGEYFAAFEYILSHPEKAREKASLALEEVYARHTVYHRAERFVLDFSRNVKIF